MMTEGREIAARAGFVKRVLSWAQKPSTGVVQFITSATDPKNCICRNAYAGYVIPKTAIPDNFRYNTQAVIVDERFYSFVMCDASGPKMIPLTYSHNMDLPMQMTRRKVACFVAADSEMDTIERKVLLNFYKIFGSVAHWAVQKGQNIVFYDAHSKPVGIIAQVVRR